jgi:hypothetical protein
MNFGISPSDFDEWNDGAASLVEKTHRVAIQLRACGPTAPARQRSAAESASRPARTDGSATGSLLSSAVQRSSSVPP